MSEGVKSAERVLAIFEVFEALRRPMRISELVKKLEIPQSSTSTLMKTLVAKGLVDFNPEERTFCPSVRLAFLGNWVLGTDDGLAQIQSMAQRLAAESGETLIVGAQNGLFVQYLAVVVSQQPLRFILHAGMLRPLHRAGLGIMLLTTKQDDEVGRMIRRFNAEADEDSVIVAVSDVLDTVRAARSLGYCETTDLATPGAGVIATLLPLPVEGRNLSIGIGGPTSRIQPRSDEFRDMLLREVDTFGRAADPFGDLDSAITGRP